jgi:PAS domain S-box-containing protein
MRFGITLSLFKVVEGEKTLDSPENKETVLKQNIKTKNRELARVRGQLRTEIEKHTLAQKQLQDRLNFETLLADVSARFISVSGDLLDRTIIIAQKQLCESLEIDYSGLWQLCGEKAHSFKLTSYYRSPDLTPDFPVPPESMDAKEHLPWELENIVKGRRVVIARIADYPGIPARDMEVYRHFGAKSVATFPLSTGGGKVLGALNFSFVLKEMDWPMEMVSRLHLAADMFAAAIARQKAEHELRESQERISLAVDSAQAGMWSEDFKTGGIWATAKAREIYGFSADEEVTSHKFQNVVHPDDRDMVNKTLSRLMQGESNLQGEFRIILPDGSTRWIRVQAKGYYSPSGQVERLTGIASDISERKQAETEMAQLRVELAHLGRVSMMNEISSALAHEINQPLGAILNNASAARLLMSGGKHSPAEINEILDDIIGDTRRAGDVVRKIRGSVKESDAYMEQLNVNVLIMDTIGMVRTNISMARITLHLDLQPDIQNVTGDHVRLQQVILNLINNATDAMADRPPRELTIRSSMEGPDTVTISVIDTGKGFDDEAAKKLFKPFFTTKKDGLGMGLRICRSIIEEHRGQIRAENNAAGGATVSFSLRAWKGEAA